MNKGHDSAISKNIDMKIIHKAAMKVLGKTGSTKKNITRIFHYTGTTVMDKLMDSATFWASNLFYLNDSTEYLYGINMLEKKLKDNKEININDMEAIRDSLDIIKEKDGKNFQGVYSISFSADEDNLHQWNTYAKESGVCLALDYDILKNSNHISFFYKPKKEKDSLSQYESLEVTSNYDITFREYGDSSFLINKIIYKGFKVEFQHLIEGIVYSIVNSNMDTSKEIEIYNGKKKPSYTDSFITFCNQFGFSPKPDFDSVSKVDQNLLKIIEVYKSNTTLFLQVLCVYLKNSAFSQEAEYRIVFNFPEEHYHPKIQYFSQKSGILRPYVEIQFKKIKKNGDIIEEETPVLPIYSIVVGPSGRQQTVFDSVIHRLRYGKKRVWNYVLEEREAPKGKQSKLKKKFNEYLSRAFQDVKEKGFEKFEKKNIESILYSEWLKEFSDASKEERINKEFVQVLFKSKFQSPPPVPDETEKQIIRFIKQNHFFSKEGIWVKKSKISYIYE